MRINVKWEVSKVKLHKVLSTQNDWQRLILNNINSDMLVGKEVFITLSQSTEIILKFF